MSRRAGARGRAPGFDEGGADADALVLGGRLSSAGRALLDRALREAGLDRGRVRVAGSRRDARGLQPAVLICLGEACARGVLGPGFRPADEGRIVLNGPRPVLVAPHPDEALSARDEGARRRGYRELVEALRQVEPLLNRAPA